MNVLVDTSVWVEHFRRPLPALVQLLRVDGVITHPLVLLELTCGTPPEPRARTLGDLALLRQTRLATPAEVADWIEREQLYARLRCGGLHAAGVNAAHAEHIALDARSAARSVGHAIRRRLRADGSALIVGDDRYRQKNIPAPPGYPNPNTSGMNARGDQSSV